MCINRIIICVLCILNASFVQASEASDAVRAWLVQDYSAGATTGVMVKIGKRVYPEATLVAAKKSSVHLKAKGLDGALPWKLLGDEGVCLLAERLISKAPMPVCEAWMHLSISCERSKEKGFRRVYNNLWKTDKAVAERIKLALAAAETSSKKVTKVSENKKRKSKKGDEEAALQKVIGTIFDDEGEVSRKLYVREATTYNGAALNRKFGPGYDYFHKDDEEPEEFPEMWLREDAGMGTSPTGYRTPYQLGTFTKVSGGYSSTVTQVLYLPEAKGDHGVDRVYVGCNANGCYWQKPFYWRPGGSHPEPAMKHAGYNEMAGGFLDKPVGLARGYGKWCNASLMVFSNGMLAAGGSNTSQDRYPKFQFPPHKVPTAITLTSQNEFALVTIWDVKELKGQVAVLSMESGYDAGDGLMSIYSWPEKYPGLCNSGGFREIKLLGYVDLPGIHAPTAISAWSNGRWWGSHLSTKESLSDQAVRDKWRAGLERKAGLPYQGGCTAGYAVVASRSEDKIAFIDLGPLFRYMSKMYFTTAENFAVTRNLGPEPDQWPKTFEAAPESAPRASKPIKVKKPTAVACSAFGSSGSWWGMQRGEGCRAYVGCMEGVLRIFATDAIASTSPAAAKVPIAEVGAIRIGRNPTCITYDKTKYSVAENSIWVVSRGDRIVQRVGLTASSAKINLTIKDKRLIDPVWADVTDNHSNRGKILLVCDFMGKALTGYRYQDVKLTTGVVVGMGPDGTDDIECTGSLIFPGHPFGVSASNVN